jgi:hypothetical protein
MQLIDKVAVVAGGAGAGGTLAVSVLVKGRVVIADIDGAAAI